MIAEAKYPVNFTQLGRQFVLTPHYNGSNGSLFVNAAEIFEFKAKDFEIKPYLLFWFNTSKGFTTNSMKKQDSKEKCLHTDSNPKPSVFELSGCGFESGNFRVWTHSETRTCQV